jgi:hypothetical protein
MMKNKNIDLSKMNEEYYNSIREYDERLPKYPYMYWMTFTDYTMFKITLESKAYI